jgi:hypothetical protein
MYVCIETEKNRVQDLRDVLLCALFQIDPLEADYPHIGHWTYMCLSNSGTPQARILIVMLVPFFSRSYVNGLLWEIIKAQPPIFGEEKKNVFDRAHLMDYLGVHPRNSG